MTEEKKKVLRSKKHVTFFEPAQEEEVPPPSVVVNQIEQTTTAVEAAALVQDLPVVEEAIVYQAAEAEKDQTESIEVTLQDDGVIISLSFRHQFIFFSFIKKVKSLGVLKSAQVNFSGPKIYVNKFW